MKVRDLIAALSELEPDTTVLVSSDEEGNSYGHVGELATEYNPMDGHLLTIYPGATARLLGRERMDAHLMSLSQEELLRIIQSDEPVEIPDHVFS